jgi:hypothetical protein
MNSILSINRNPSSIIFLSASVIFMGQAIANELTKPETHHFVSCPDPVDTPCIMKRPFNAMDYTVLTKDVNISEGNGVWIVSFAKNPNKAIKKQIIKVMDFYGELHIININVAESIKSENTTKSSKSNARAIAPEIKNSSSSKEPDAKPISLEKYISK